MKGSNNDKMAAILRRLKPEMNGAVTGDMEARGVRYGLNYGVAVPVIRQAASQFAPDHELAEYLFRQDIRELKLAAVYVDNPEQVTSEQMECWASAMPADEVMEHAAMNLFYAAPKAEEIITDWLGGDDRVRWKGALHMTGRAAAKGMLSTEQGNGYLQQIETFLRNKKNPPFRATVYSLSKLAGISDELHRRIQQTASAFAGTHDTLLRDIGEETAVLLKYSR